MVVSPLFFRVSSRVALRSNQNYRQNAEGIMQLSDKLAKVDNSVSITKYDNGYLLEVRGENSSEDWSEAAILCSDLTKVIELVTEWHEMQLR